MVADDPGIKPVQHHQACIIDIKHLHGAQGFPVMVQETQAAG